MWRLYVKKKINKGEIGWKAILNAPEEEARRNREENASRRRLTAAAWERVKNVPSLQNIGNLISSAVDAYVYPEEENPRLLYATYGTAPDITGAGKVFKAISTIGKISKAVNTTKKVSKATKLANWAAKEDKVLKIGKKVKTQSKYGKGFDTGDARHVNSGLSKVKNSLVRLALDQMADASYNVGYSRELNRLNVKLAKATSPEAQARIRGEIRDLAKKFINEGLLH